MTDNNERLDLCDAWFDWKETCALDNCSREHRNALEGIARKRFAAYLKSLGNTTFYSDLADYANDPGKLLFHEVESALYLRQKIKGQAFKSYLFDVVAQRPHGAAANLTGYVLKMAFRTILKSSTKKGAPAESTEDDDRPINAPEDQQRWRKNNGHDNDSLQPEVSGAMPDHDAEQLIASHVAQWDFDTMLALVCTQHRIPLSNSDVQRLASRKKSAFALLVEKAQRPLVNALRERDYADADIAALFRTTLLPMLDAWTAHNPQCQALLKKLAQ